MSEFEKIILAGFNAGAGLITNCLPGGKMAADTAIDGALLACKMGEVVLPKLKDGLTPEEVNEIIQAFKANVPETTWHLALDVMHSMIKTAGFGALKL